MRLVRGLLVVVLPIAIAAGAVFYLAGRASGPTIRILQPTRLVGVSGTLDVTVEAPGGRFTSIDASLEQGGRVFPLFSLGSADEGTLRQETADRIRIARPIGRRAIPELTSGPARLWVRASRPVLFGLRSVRASETLDVQVQLEPPRAAVVSTGHYVNHGGSEMVVYRVSPPKVDSGVRVGDVAYPGYPASGAGVTADPALRVAFFALTHDQDLNTPIRVYARDEAGNEAAAPFEYRVFPKSFKRSRVEVDDRFLARVVPEIVQHTSDLAASAGGGDDLSATFLRINGDLRRANAEAIAALAAKTGPRILWHGPFQPPGGAQVESSFADHRTYIYKGREIDQQVHLGFDLAATTAVPIVAGNDGDVLHAAYLGIYGNCVILDHGMGVQSLYGHLSSIDVTVGDSVRRNQTLGRSGMTGLAGGDHLHFTMLVQGRPVNPVEWWDPHWIEDRILRKLREAGAGATGQP